MTEITKVRFHGSLGKRLKKKSWNVSINNIREAFRAVNILSKRKLQEIFLQDLNKKLRYKIKVNNKPIDVSGIDVEDLSTIDSSELVMHQRIKTLDVVPVLEGSGSDFMAAVLIVVAIVLIVVGMALVAAGGSMFSPPLVYLGYAMISAGDGLLTVGVSMLMSKSPEMPGPPEIGDVKKSQSYLFNGPVNSQREGVPVPLGYGRLLCGSQIIQSSRSVRQMTIAEIGTYRAR
jgi:predicted phage tail protein